jgi:hypothetical protein
MQDLKLIALDPDDLQVLSCHLQDAVIRVGDMAYLKAELCFAALVNRFDWEGAAQGQGNQRKRAGLRFERVTEAKLTGIDLRQKDAVLSLLAVTFDPGESPSGTVTLTFAGGGAIRLGVECIESELRDLGAAWRAGRQPEHSGGDKTSG